MSKLASRWRKLLIGASALMASVVPFSASSAQEGDTLHVGIIVPLTGSGAGSNGIPSRDAAEMLFREIAAGRLPKPYDTPGFGGWKVADVLLDEEGGTTKLVQGFRDLVQRRGVDLTIGLNSSGSCLAAAPVAEELKTLLVMFDCGTPRIFEEASYDYVFRPVADGTITSTGAAYLVKELFPQAKKVAGINQNYAWGQDSWRDFQLAAKVILPGVDTGTSLMPRLFQGQYGSEITRLMSDKPDVIFSSFWGGDLEAFLAQGSARGLFRNSHLIVTLGEIVMFELADKIPEGAIVGGRSAFGVLAHDTELNRWFRKTYQESFKRQPTYAPYEMAQSVIFLKAAADKAQAANGGKRPTLDQIRAAMVKLHFEAFGNKVEMAFGKGHQAISEAAFGEFHNDPKTGPTLTNIRYFPPECVAEPEGTTSVKWLEAGMPGTEKCRQ